MGKIKKFNEFKKNEAFLPEVEEPTTETPKIDVNRPFDVEGVSLGNEGSQLDIELRIEAKHQEAIALKKGLKQKGTPDNHIS